MIIIGFSEVKDDFVAVFDTVHYGYKVITIKRCDESHTVVVLLNIKVVIFILTNVMPKTLQQIVL